MAINQLPLDEHFSS